MFETTDKQSGHKNNDCSGFIEHGSLTAVLVSESSPTRKTLNSMGPVHATSVNGQDVPLTLPFIKKEFGTSIELIRILKSRIRNSSLCGHKLGTQTRSKER